ncbi:MAG: type II CAAX endopeptidase family protein [Planctomycetota bacterium]|nr:type II CAAX endopeptidase family protein [Planctomycetota bacterium]
MTDPQDASFSPAARDDAGPPPPPPAGEPRPALPPRSLAARLAILWWLPVLAICGLLAAGHATSKGQARTLPPPGEAPSVMLEFAARMDIGLHTIGGAAAAAGAQPASQQQVHSPLDRLRYAAVMGEVRGAAAAQEVLDAAQKEIEQRVIPEARRGEAALPADAWFVEDDAARAALLQDVAALRRIYETGRGADAPLDAAARARLVERHGWFAQVALSFGGDASDPFRKAMRAAGVRSVIAVSVAAVAIVLAGLAGLVLFIVMLVLLAQGRLTSGFKRSAGPLRSMPPGLRGVFLETFALFMIVFLGASLAAGPLSDLTGLPLRTPILWSVLLVAFWPLVRGAGADAWRAGLGWHSGRGVMRELAAGVVGYIAGLPLLGVGVCITLVLTVLTRGDAAHPVAGEFGGQSFWGTLELLLLLTVWAPVVEETFFRGALLAHLRRRWALPLAAVVSAVLFAIIHPQGVLGVPVVGAIGVNLALIREWRGSLLACMAGHALNNGFVGILLVLVMG